MQTTPNTAVVKILQVLNWVFFSLMVFVNYLANALPINNKNTGELSNQYPNLFVPAPLTFAIWGVIYLLVLVFCVVQSKSLFSRNADPITAILVSKIGLFFIVSCLFNVGWILVWHYEYQILSVVFMLGILGSLIALNLRIDAVASFLPKSALFAAKSPFGLYLGWICVATVANATATLVHNGWQGAGQSESFWACAMIVVAAFIVCFALLKVRNFYVGLAVIWALAGIINARLSAETYQRFIVWTAVFGIGLVAIFTIMEAIKTLFRKKEVLPEPV
ncbi:MAG: hypothetical protein EAZ32_06405 [Cytophagia bacterium]|nr:MAG: hypothetical protein EAZ46_07550 [Runella sp.]TAG19533.1 MAG: hypothetical protein EAZ38_12225 [Cytophagales bacterium]TAG40499.1 MAG: hypothetical protein EAZ32_06405 [Cytophagia bacterium]TAG69836.1 MAG: hypothetical protein EAZ26_06605 [Runella slithyformis]TAG80372.1 MAG: hypothetical protein EAZ22_09650 [Cytophagales bacterium]